jgi:hypothetical protein
VLAVLSTRLLTQNMLRTPLPSSTLLYNPLFFNNKFRIQWRIMKDLEKSQEE